MSTSRSLTALLAAAVLLTACAGAPTDDVGSRDVPTGTTSAEPRDEGGPDGDEPQPAGATTAATLERFASMDADHLASLHDHSDHDHHEMHESNHPNGVDPERIVIPALGVDADVIDLGLQDDGTMEVPSDFAQTGWFRPGPRPGRVGPAVIAGHVDSRSGPAVFHRLHALEPGDRIEVHGEDGEVVVFEVDHLESHPKDDFPTEAVYSGTDGPELRLITCSGEFDRDARSYQDNTIAFATRVDA